MYVDRYPTPRKAGPEPKSFRSAYTGSTLSTNDSKPKKTGRNSNPSSPSPVMLQFDMALDRTLSRVDELSLKGSPNHRHQRQSKLVQGSPHSRNSGSASKLPIGRISDFFRGRESKDSSIPDLFGAGSGTFSEGSGEFSLREVQITTNNTRNMASSSPRANECTNGRSGAKALKTCRSKPARQRSNGARTGNPSKAKTTPRLKEAKDTFYPDVFVPPAPLDRVQSAVYAEFNSSKAEVTLSSTTIDRRWGSPRAACNQSLRISVTPTKSRSPRTPKKPPLAPCLFESPSAASLADAMRALNQANTRTSQNARRLDYDEDDDGDDSTLHLLEIAHSSHMFSVEENHDEDPTIPPKLRVTTSTSSATAFLDEEMPSMPVLQSQTTSSSIQTIEWKSYPKYYEADKAKGAPSRAISEGLPPLGRATSNSTASTVSDKKPAAVSTPPVMAQGMSMHHVPQTLEVAPGHFVNLRGANETLLYVAADATSTRNMIATQECVACRSVVHSVSDCEFVLCPVCHTILSTGIDGHGVGLGFLTSDWDEWNFNLLQVETAAECPSFAQMQSKS